MIAAAAAVLLAASPYLDGRALLAAGRPAEALRAFESARDSIPAAHLDLRVAEAEAALGRLDEAVGRLERVVEAEGASLLGRRALAQAAWLLFRGGRPLAAADRYRDLALAGEAETPRWLFATAEALEAAGETAAAHGTYRSILWGYPESGYAHRAIGRIDALLADSGGVLPPVRPYDVLLAGRVALERGDALSAEAKFRILEEGTVDLELRDDVLYYAGVAAMRLSKYDDALARFRALRSDFPRSPHFHEAGLRILQTYVYRGDELNPYLLRLYLREGIGPEAEDVRLEIARYERAHGRARSALELYAGVQGRRSLEARYEEALVHEDLEDRWAWERAATAVLAAADTTSIDAEALRYAQARRAEVEGRVEEALEQYTRLAGEGRHPLYLGRAREAVLRLAENRYREAAAEDLWAKARTLEARGDSLGAYLLWRTIVFGYPETTFRLEAEAEARRIVASLPGWPGAPPSAALLADGLDTAGRRALQVVLALEAAGAADEAAEILGGLPPSPARLSLLARLAAAAGRPHAASAAADSLIAAWPVPVDRAFLPETFARIVWPIAFETSLADAGDSFGVDPALLAAIARRASRFDPTAVAGVRLGLLGVDPVGAEWAVRELKAGPFRVVDLFRPETNAVIGAFLIATIRRTFEEAHLVAAAHWAGPGNVEAWLAAGMPRDEERFVERIPFPEARAFARDVLADLLAYRALYPQRRRVR